MSTSPESGTPAPDPAATTPPPSSPPAPDSVASMHLTLGELVPTARALVFGLGWGAIMLVVLGFWMRSKNAPTTRFLTTVFLIAGAVSAGLAVWQAFTLWFKQEAPADKAGTLGQQRRILGNLFLVGGLAMIGVAFYLGIGKKPGGETGLLWDNLAESIGVVLFGVIALGSGYFLTLSPRADGDSSMRSLVGMTPMLKLLQLIIGAVAIASFCVIAYRTRAGVPPGYLSWIPELVALLFLSILCFACVIWLNTGQPDETGMRVFVLVFGGSLGLILFLYTVARAYLWRQDIFLGGIPSWQGPNAWRFWLVAYLQIVALILMFVSFRFARTDIRSNVTLRRVMYGYDAILQGLLLVEVLAVLNVVIYALVPFTYDWTKTRGLYNLSDASRNLIEGLKKEINVVVLMRQGNPIYKDLRNLLDNCSALNSSKFIVTYISPDSDPEGFEDLVKAFPKIKPETGGVSSGVLLVDGKIPQSPDKDAASPPYTFVVDRKLQESDRPRGGKETRIFKGEGEILKEVKFLVTDKQKRKIFVLQGDEEADINNKEGRERIEFRDSFSQVGIGLLIDRLTGDGYDVIGLSFRKEIGKAPPNVVFATEDGKKKDIPGDCQTLIIPGISKKLSPEALEGIERYLDRGGKLIAFFDVVVDDEYSKMKESGLEGLLKRYGVEVTSDFPLRVPLEDRDDARLIFAVTPRDSTNPLAREFARKLILVKRTARVVKASETPGRYRAETVLQAEKDDDNGFYYTLEKKFNVLMNPQGYMRARGRKVLAAVEEKPIPLAVAVVESPGDKPRIVVFGDTELITNVELARSPTARTNYSFVVSAIEWMAGREDLMGTQVKQTTTVQLGRDVNYARMIFLPGWIMLLSLIGFGIAVWMVRRR
jgi:ABC-type uncharacterized transport system